MSAPRKRVDAISLEGPGDDTIHRSFPGCPDSSELLALGVTAVGDVEQIPKGLRNNMYRCWIMGAALTIQSADGGIAGQPWFQFKCRGTNVNATKRDRAKREIWRWFGNQDCCT